MRVCVFAIGLGYATAFGSFSLCLTEVVFTSETDVLRINNHLSWMNNNPLNVKLRCERSGEFSEFKKTVGSDLKPMKIQTGGWNVLQKPSCLRLPLASTSPADPTIPCSIVFYQEELENCPKQEFKNCPKQEFEKSANIVIPRKARFLIAPDEALTWRHQENDLITYFSISKHQGRFQLPFVQTHSTYEIIELLGQSAWGVVWKAQLTWDKSQFVVVKQGSITSGELGLLKQRNMYLDEKYVTKDHLIDEKDPPTIVMKYIKGHTLNASLTMNPPHFHGNLLELYKHALEELNGIHQLGFRHGNPSPDHIILDEKSKPHLIGYSRAEHVSALRLHEALKMYDKKLLTEGFLSVSKRVRDRMELKMRIRLYEEAIAMDMKDIEEFEERRIRRHTF